METLKFKNLSNKATGFWNFQKNRVFVGTFLKREIIEKTKTKTEEVFQFADYETGLVWNLSGGSCIKSALETVINPEEADPKKHVTLENSGKILRIEFIEKIKLKNGNNYNKFAIQYAE